MDHNHDHSNHDHHMMDSNKPTKLTDYLPLLTIFIYIIVGSLVLSSARTDLNLMNFMYYFMGLFFGIFSLFKLLDLKGFVDGYSTYDIIAKKFRNYGFVYPFIEAGLAIAYLSHFDNALLHLFTLVIMIVGSIGIAQSLMRKSQIQCACLGNVLKVPLSTISLFENLLMATMSLIMLFI